MVSAKEFGQEIENIKERNARVEADKAWETSWTRRLLIAVLTYFVVVLFFLSAGLARPFLSALIPTMGFLLSTLTLPVAKRRWLALHKK